MHKLMEKRMKELEKTIDDMKQSKRSEIIISTLPQRITRKK